MSPPRTPSHVAFMDIGTNSVRLLVVRFVANHAYRIVTDQKEVVRLGEGEFADRRLHPAAMARCEVRRRGHILRLKPKEYELLTFLSRNPGVVFSRQSLLEAVWGRGQGNTRTVDVHVCWLRNKIEADPNHPQRLVTVRGFGYRFEG